MENKIEKQEMNGVAYTLWRQASQQMKHQGYKSWSTKICIGILLPIIFLACSKDKTFEEVSPVKLNVIHASVDFGPMNISNNGTSLVSNLAFGDFSAYQSIDKINSVLSISRSATVKIDRTLGFNQFGKFTLVVVDSLRKLQTVMLSNDTTSFSTNKAVIRFLHTSSLMQNVQLRLRYKDSVRILARFYDDLLAQTTLVQKYDSVDVGTFKLDVLRIRNNAADSLFYSKQNVVLQTGKRYTAFTIGKIGGIGAEAFALKIVED
jgi:Domain of unknown function (DUF4397)